MNNKPTENSVHNDTVSTVSLSETIEILSDIWNTNASIPGNEHILERIHTYVKTQLPQSIKNYQSAHIERETRKQSLELIANEITERFLNRTKYFYCQQSELYFTYNNQVRYSLIHEDEIHHRILADITSSAANVNTNSTVTAWKYKIKNRIIKSIQGRDILSAIPESRTIQNVIAHIYPSLFHSRDHAKYFLTILGDVLLKKSAPLIYFIPPVAKEFIKDLGCECYGLFGSTSNTFATAFKFKYYEHHYKDCRIVDIHPPILGGSVGGGEVMNTHHNHSHQQSLLRLSHMSDLKSSIIDLFCVAAHYSHRFSSADDFLRLHCKTPDVASHAWFLSERTEQQIIQEFIDYATEPASSEHEISMTNMLYLWKLYLSQFRLPSMFFAATLKSKLLEYAASASQPPTSSSISQDVFPNRISKYLPIVSKFRSFWNQHCFIDDKEIELEIDELSTLFNEYMTEMVSTPAITASSVVSPGLISVSDQTLLGMLRHFYPDIIIEDDKYILNVGCKLWDKNAEINEYLIQFKEQCITNNHSFPQPLYNAYEYYCGRCYATAKRRIISKRYFEKYFMEEYANYIDENGMIMMSWWVEDDANTPEHTYTGSSAGKDTDAMDYDDEIEEVHTLS